MEACTGAAAGHEEDEALGKLGDLRYGSCTSTVRVIANRQRAPSLATCRLSVRRGWTWAQVPNWSSRTAGRGHRNICRGRRSTSSLGGLRVPLQHLSREEDGVRSAVVSVKDLLQGVEAGGDQRSFDGAGPPRQDQRLVGQLELTYPAASMQPGAVRLATWMCTLHSASCCWGEGMRCSQP